MTAQQTFKNTLVVVFTLLLLYIAALSIRILIVLLVAIIIASALRPMVVGLHKRRVPEGLAILFTYLLVFAVIVTLGVAILPPAFNQLGVYLSNGDLLAERLISAQSWFQGVLSSALGFNVTLADPANIKSFVTNAIGQVQASAPTLAGDVGGLVGDFILVVVMGFYWLTARDQGVEYLLSLFPIGQRAGINQVVTDVEHSLGAYVRGIVLVGLFVGVANFAILRLFNVPNAVTLAFIIGFTTLLPIIGGYIGAGTAFLIALLISPLYALITLGSFIAIQQIENHYLTPRVMARSVGLNPILVIVFLFAGFALGGVAGALLSVPVAGVVTIVLRHLVIDPRKETNAPQFIDGGILLTPAGGPDAPTPAKAGSPIVTPSQSAVRPPTDIQIATSK